MALKKMPVTGATRTAVVGVVLVGLAAGAMMIAQRGPAVLSKMTEAVSAAPAPDAAVPAPKLLLAAPAKSAESAAPKTAARSAAAKPAAKPAVVMAAAKPAVVMAAATTPAVNAPGSASANAVAQSPELTTLTGCLQHDDGTFRLKDTAGADAPKSRTWKSGFLKKSAASVEIVDSGNRLQLPTHVGQKVTVTGVLLDKELRARAVQRLGVCS